MALHKYFKINQNDQSSSKFSSTEEDVAQIVAAHTSTSRKRGKYTSFDEAYRYKIGKHAAENGNKSAQKKFLKEDGDQISESTIRNFKKQYLYMLKDRKRSGDQMQFDLLPKKKQGRPSLLDPEVEEELTHYIKKLRGSGAVVNCNIVCAITKGILKKRRPVVARNIELKKEWAWSFLEKMGFSKRKGNFINMMVITNDHDVINSGNRLLILILLVIFGQLIRSHHDILYNGSNLALASVMCCYPAALTMKANA